MVVVYPYAEDIYQEDDHMDDMDEETIRRLAKEFKRHGFENRFGFRCTIMLGNNENAEELLDYLESKDDITPSDVLIRVIQITRGLPREVLR